MRSILLPILLAPALCAAAKERARPPPREPEAPVEWQVVYERSERAWKQNEEGAAREKKTRLSLRFGPAYFYLFDGDGLSLYDFSTARMSRISKGERREDSPLLAEVQTREMELRREADQVALLARSGTPLPDAELTLFLAESRAGITTSLADFAGRMTMSGAKEKVWTVAGTLVAGWVTGDTEIPKAFSPMVERFLLYQLPLHPELRSQLMAERALPRLVRYREKVGGLWREVRLDLASAETRRDSLLPELKPTTVPDETAHPLTRVVAVASGRVDRGIRPTSPEEYGRQYRGLLEQGLYLESLLAILEFYLQSGADTEQPMTRLESHVESDAELAAFMDAMAIGTADEAAASLGHLARIDRAKLMRRHIYDVAAANAMLAVGRYREAEPLYLAALDHNPWLTGVYKKLGDLYAASERLPLAWTAYEAALRINGTHPMLKPILAEGPRLMKAYPDFFLPQAETGP